MHQPVGNLPWVIEEAYQKAYLPLFRTIANYTEIKINLHISGPLLIWLKNNHPEFLDIISELNANKQVEIIGGGFYEPILAIIPEEDRLRQIIMMVDWWKENYGISPKGIWLAERVWVPDLPSTLQKLGIEYTFIDDYLLHIIGLSEEETFYTYETEYQGNSVTIFPINESIRYFVPWKSPSESIEYLKKACDQSHEKIVVMISDAEKMGVWPAGDRTTHDICYVSGYDGTKGWMDSFFESILEHSWIKSVLISEYMENHGSQGLIYLPTSSYDKMAIWALPTPLRKRIENLRTKALENDIPNAEDVLMFTQGSIWQNFLVKYSQSNVMHKRMLYCREKLNRIASQISISESNEIWDNILASQSNDSYWSGMFGGIYYRFLRHACLKFVNTAEYLIDRACQDNAIILPELKIQDVLLDGQLDGILENKSISCFVSSLRGGSVFSLNLKKGTYDFQNVLRRKLEAYHTDDAAVAEDSIEKWTFQDHFFREISTIQKYQSNQYKDIGNFTNQKYTIEHVPKGRLSLNRFGKILGRNEEDIPCSVSKSYCLQESSLIVDYEINFPEGKGENIFYFSPEMNFLGASYPYKTHGYLNERKFNLSEFVTEEQCTFFMIQDLNELEKVSLSVTFPESVKCMVFPVYSFTKTEIGFEEQYQGTSLFPFFKITESNHVFQIEVILSKIA